MIIPSYPWRSGRGAVACAMGEGGKVLDKLFVLKGGSLVVGRLLYEMGMMRGYRAGGLVLRGERGGGVMSCYRGVGTFR